VMVNIKKEKRSFGLNYCQQDEDLDLKDFVAEKKMHARRVRSRVMQIQ